MSGRSWVVSSTVVPRAARSATRNVRSRSLLTRSSPMVGSSSTSSSGECSSAAVTSPRIRWPSESCRTGVARNGSMSSSSTHSSSRGSPGRRPAAGGWRRAAGTTRAAAGPTTAGCAGRTRRRSGGPARAAAAPGPARTPGPARGRHQHPGEHLDRGRLAGPVGADEADALARRDRNVIPSTAATTSRFRRSRPAAGVRRSPGAGPHVDDHEPVPSSGAPRCARPARRGGRQQRRPGARTTTASRQPERVGRGRGAPAPGSRPRTRRDTKEKNRRSTVP